VLLDYRFDETHLPELRVAGAHHAESRACQPM